MEKESEKELTKEGFKRRRKLQTCHSERSEESKGLVRNHDATRLTGPSLGALRF